MTTVQEVYNTSGTVVSLTIESGIVSFSDTFDLATQAGKDAYNDAIEEHVGGRPDDRK